MVNRGINKVILIGYLGQDPEIHYMTNGNSVTKISIATTESWKDKKTNESKDKTEWHRVVIFGKLAEIASSYLRKGSQVYIEGSLRTRKWKNQDGQERYITEIIVSIGGVMYMLGHRYTEGNITSSNESLVVETNSTDPSVKHDKTLNDESVMNFGEDDIPF